MSEPYSCNNGGDNLMCWVCWGVKEHHCDCPSFCIKFCKCKDNNNKDERNEDTSSGNQGSS